MKLKAGIIVGMMLIGFIPLLNDNSSITNDSTKVTTLVEDTIIENYTYRTQSGEFDTLITEPESTQATIEGFETAWGKFGLLDSSYFFQDLEINGVNIAENQIYDPWVEYWYLNSTGQAGRKFAASWEDCDWRILLNDSQFLVVQKSAESIHQFSFPTMEWNLTIRICVNKMEPIIMFDYWLKNLNETSLIREFHLAGMPYFSGCDNETQYTSRQTVTQSGPGYCFAEVGPGAGNWGDGSSLTHWGVMDYKCFVKGSYGEYIHAANAWTIAETESEALALAARVGSSWNRWVDSPDVMNLLVVNNSERYDTWTYVSSEDFTYIPSETVEVVYANGDWYNATFYENQIDNYRRAKTLIHIDDYAPSYPGGGEDYAWAANKIREYDTPASLLVNLGVLGAYYAYRTAELVNMSLERDGTLFEVGDHSWNHTSWTTYWQREYAMTVFNLTYNRWYDYNGDVEETMFTHATAGTSFGNETVWAVADFGFKTLRTRLRTQDTEMLRLYNDTLLIMGFQSYISVAPTNITDWINMSNVNSYHMTVWHVGTELNEAAEKIAWESYLSVLENQSALMPITSLQFYDYYRGLLNYSTINGLGHIDMTNCSDGHKIFLKPNADSNFPVFMDETSGTTGCNGEYAWLYGQRGHVYDEIMTFNATANTTLEMTGYAPALSSDDAVVLTWEMSDFTGTANFIIPGLDSNLGYMVYQNGESVYLQPGGVNTLTFTVTNGGAFKVLVWKPSSSNPFGAAFEYYIEGDKVTFTDKSYGGVTQWIWSFGDGYGSTSLNPVHTYLRSGFYTISLLVLDDDGGSSKAQTVIEIEFGVDNPIDRVDDGWNVYMTETTTVSIMPMGLMFFGVILLLTGKFVRRLPIFTQIGRIVLGSMLILLGLTYYIFIDNSWLGLTPLI